MRLIPVIAGLTMAGALSCSSLAIAQVVGTENESESDVAEGAAAADADAPTDVPAQMIESRVMDEITVTVDPEGRTAYELEMERLAQIREDIFAEMELREREQEEQAWRQADRDLQNPESRIKWGYSPQAEQRMRRESDFIYDLPFEQTRPATVFRVGF